jgi:dihydropteroate synthase
LPSPEGEKPAGEFGAVLGGAPLEERLFGTAASVALAIAHGADLVRVHDARAMRDVARVSDAIVRGWRG